MRRSPFITTALTCLSLLALWLQAGPALGQVFHEDHTGIHLMATAPGGDGHDCAGGPDDFLLTASEYGFFTAVSMGWYGAWPFEVPVAKLSDFEGVAEGVPLGRFPSIENTGDFRSWYVGFSCDTGMNTPGSHLFRLDLDGQVELVVHVDEFKAVSADLCAGISEIGVAPDGRLLVMLSGPSSTARMLVTVDLDAAPDQRVSVLMDQEGLMDALSASGGQTVTNLSWGRTFAVDDQGRVFLHVQAQAEDPSGPTGLKSLVVRLDPDGGVTEMTARESTGADPNTSITVAGLPAIGMQGGLEFDSRTGLIVGSGYGIWVMHPDLPGRAQMIISPEQMAAAAEALVGDSWRHRPIFSIWGSCLATTEAGLLATHVHTYSVFTYDPDLLDLDRDLLDGLEEAQQGTDPWDPDTDGGGIQDGLECSDITDPLNPGDDRLWADAPDGVALTNDHEGAAFTQAFEPYGLSHHGVARWDGSLLVSRFEDATDGVLQRFRGYQHPPEETLFQSTEEPLAADSAGNIYSRSFAQGIYQVVRTNPNGQSVPVADPAEVSNLLGGEDLTPRCWAADPDGRVWMGFDKGRILRAGPEGGVELFYDGWQDLAKAGGVEMTNGCSPHLTTQAMAWEPVHGAMLVALNRFWICAGATYVSPVYVAIGFDDRILRIGDSGDYPKVTSSKGGGDALDIEPDWTGGFYLLLAHGVDRSLIHYDASWRARVMTDLREEHLPEGAPLDLRYATDILVTRGGEHYAIMGREYGETPVHFVLRRFEPVGLEQRLGSVDGPLSLPTVIRREAPPQAGGCSRNAAPNAPGAGLLLLLLLALLGWARGDRRRLPALLVLATLVTACGVPSGGSKQDTAEGPDTVDDLRAGVDSDDATAIPDAARPDPCLDIDTCDPTALAVCVDAASHRRCQLSEEGCWVWSATRPCPDGQPCANGVCQDCRPSCTAFQDCGDDGCGGTCGTCDAGTICCMDLFCGPCLVDCDGRDCGHDGAGGTCGECPAGETCAAGICLAEGSGRCVDLFPCQADCAPWDLACIDRCEPLLDASSSELAAAYQACASYHCVDCPLGDGGQECMDDCILTQCAAPFADCAAQGGTVTCKDMYACVFSCEPGDEECMDACYFSAFPSNLLFGITLELCVSEHCDTLPPEPDAWTCWGAAVTGPCAGPFTACIGGPCDDSCEGINCGLNDCLIPCGPPCED